MGAVNLAGMAPNIVLSGQPEGQLLVLPVVPAYINGVAVGGLEAHGGEPALLGTLAPRLLTQIALLLQFLPNLLQLGIGLSPVQLLQHALQIAHLPFAQSQLVGQLLLGVLHPGVILVEFRRILLGGEQGAQGDFHRRHVLIVEVLADDLGLPLGNPMNVGGQNVPQLAQTLPVIGSRQLLFLQCHLPGKPGAQILHRFAHGLALLTHGVLPIPEGVKAVQQCGKGFLFLAASVLAQGAEGVLLGRAVRLDVHIGFGMVQVLPEEKQQLFRRVVHIKRTDPGIRASGGEQCRLPADQGRQSPQGIHEPVREQIRPGCGQNVYIIFQRQRIFFGNRLRLLVVKPGQGRPAAGLVQADAPEAVQNPTVGPQQIQVASPAHQLRGQGLPDGKAHFVGALKGKIGRPLHGQLGNFRQLRSQQVLSQEHTEHGRLRGIFRACGGQMEPGRGGIGGKQQLLPVVPPPEVKNHRIPAGLVDFIHPCPQAFSPHLLQHGGKKKCVKCHYASSMTRWNSSFSRSVCPARYNAPNSASSPVALAYCAGVADLGTA